MNKFALMMMIFSGLVMFSACSDSNGSEGGDDGGNDGGQNTDLPMNSEQQKEYIETVANELMGEMPASDFEGISQFCEDFGGIAGGDVDDWIDDAVNGDRDDEVDAPVVKSIKAAAGMAKSGKNHTDINEYPNGEGGMNTYIHNYIYTDYKAFIAASTFTGHFTAVNGRWVKDAGSAGDLQFSFKDRAGRDCVMRLETAGNTKNVHLFAEEDHNYSDYDYVQNGNGTTTTYTYYYDNTEYTVAVPERITLTLTQGGSTVMRTEVNVSISELAGEEFNLSRDNVSFTAVTDLSNGYKANVSQAAYTANSKVAANAELSKNGKSLMTFAVASDISGIPSLNISALGDIDLDDLGNATGKNAIAKVDILGKIQIQGTLSDIHQLIDYLNKAEDNDENESLYKSYLNQANSLMNIGVYYNNSQTRQASLRLEPFYHEHIYGYGHGCWENEPVIVFSDGTSYSTFDAFFDEDSFKSVIDGLKNYAKLFGWEEEEDEYLPSQPGEYMPVQPTR
ncbi:MAG: hypothetical protein J6B33_02660 [Prevotella sp.]|nr:hypothetical protein [Prevotella sp.]